MTGELPRQQEPAEGDRAKIERELDRAEKREGRREPPQEKRKREQDEAERGQRDRP